MEITIPCEKIARLSNILKFFPDYADEWSDSFRLEDQYVMMTNRCFMVVERVPGMSVSPAVHITADETLIEQCRNETQFSSNLHLIINHILGIATIRTTMGYTHPGNLLMRHNTPNKLDEWKSVIPMTPLDASRGGLALDLKQVKMLIEASPSKVIVFEENINANVPTIVRDKIDPDWFGVFRPDDDGSPHEPATLPGWFK